MRKATGGDWVGILRAVRSDAMGVVTLIMKDDKTLNIEKSGLFPVQQIGQENDQAVLVTQEKDNISVRDRTDMLVKQEEENISVRDRTDLGSGELVILRKDMDSKKIENGVYSSEVNVRDIKYGSESKRAEDRELIAI